MSDHQLCIIHVSRNLRRQVDKSGTEIEAEEHFRALIELLEKKYPNLAKNLVEKKKNILAFGKYPKDVKRYIYTTNLAEGINSAINEIWLKRPIYVTCGSSNEILQVLNIKFKLSNKI